MNVGSLEIMAVAKSELFIRLSFEPMLFWTSVAGHKLRPNKRLNVVDG